MTTSVLIVDNEEMFSHGVSLLLSAEEDLVVVGQVTSCEEALEVIRRDPPDVVLMDVRMPNGIDGITATRQITADAEAAATTKVLILTTFDEDAVVYGGLRSGASGFLLKQAGPGELVTAIRKVVDGGSWIDPSVAPRVIAAMRTLDEQEGTLPSGLLERLTPREVEVLRHVAQGITNEQIAERLSLSPATVRTHITRIMMKTGCTTRAQLVVLAYESGLVVPRNR